MIQRTRNGKTYWVEPGTKVMVTGVLIHRETIRSDEGGIARGRHYVLPPDDPVRLSDHFISIHYVDWAWNNCAARIPWERGYGFFEAVDVPYSSRITLGAGGGITLFKDAEEKAWAIAREWGCIVRENTRGVE